MSMRQTLPDNIERLVSQMVGRTQAPSSDTSTSSPVGEKPPWYVTVWLDPTTFFTTSGEVTVYRGWTVVQNPKRWEMEGHVLGDDGFYHKPNYL